MKHSSDMATLLRCQAHLLADAVAFTTLSSLGEEVEQISFRALDQRAQHIASILNTKVSKGARVLLCFPTGIDFIAAFFGCIYAEVIPIPSPHSAREIERLAGIVKDANVSLIFTAAGADVPAKVIGADGGNKCLVMQITQIGDGSGPLSWQLPVINAESIAYIQYSSGSTGTPKGVVVTHKNLLHNLEMMAEAFQHDPLRTTIVSWLPLFHDMGLIGNVLSSVYVGVHCVLLSPASFLKRPYVWLQAISHYKATYSGAPNFAYELCTRRVSAEQRATLDLSAWELAFNGSEPVQAKVLESFAATFAESKFPRNSLYPCYGLAEATLFVTGGRKQSGPAYFEADRTALEAGVAQIAIDSNRVTLVSCGRVWSDQKLLIVDPKLGTPCAEKFIGEIWIGGESVSKRYWTEDEAESRPFLKQFRPGGRQFLPTGDLGFVMGEELFVTGRLKDMIIIRGRNLFPEDIEQTVWASNASLVAGGGAVFTVDVDEKQSLIVVQEIKREHRLDLDQVKVRSDIVQAITETYRVSPQEVRLVSVGSVPKTSSGKVQRSACKSAYLAGTLTSFLRLTETHVHQPTN
jgi:acyl-CoA synthetase (AMP-forming)/AMP-acid ligase II